jgi:amidase
MSIKSPTPEQLRTVADDLGLSLSDDDVAEFGGMMAATLRDYYGPLDALPDNIPEVTYPRTPGHRPGAEEDPLHAWYVKSTVTGAASGKLAGNRVVLKDNICLAGVPMMNGASTLEGYVPDVDATVVTRILDAGGEIAGKAHCEYFCFSGGSHTNATGATHNPHKRGYSAGGSSSGCAALVGAGEIEMAIGGDQGGSIRAPASFCGVYGMKATHGLVPYTGVMPIELTLDHVGPMTGTVADNALLLEVVAGADGLDPRQYAPQTAAYTEALGRDLAGLKIGIVAEGFDWPHSQPDVDAKVRAAADRLAGLGATVSDISLPMHRLGMNIWLPMGVEGATELMMKGNGFGTNWRGLYVTSLLDAHSAWRGNANSLSEILKLGIMLGQYMHRYYHGHYYAKAQNLSRQLRAVYDEALAEYDLLLMPTCAIKAPPLPPESPTRLESMSPGFDPITNTAPFDATGHPAMNIPCGMSEGLPIGMMLIAKHWDETTIYRAAHAFEQSADWKQI